MALNIRDGAVSPATAKRFGQIVADVEVSPSPRYGDLRIKGEFVVPRELMEEALSRITNSLEHTKDGKVIFDAAKGTFVISGKYDGLPFWHPKFRMELKPIIKDGAVGLEQLSFEHAGPHWLFDDWKNGKIAECVTKKGYPATWDAKAKTFWLDTNQVLHTFTKLPYNLNVDLGGAKLGLKADAEGDLVVDLGEPLAEQPTKTHATIRMDKGPLMSLMNEAFGERFQVTDIAFGDRTAKITGKAKSEIMDGVAAFVMLFAMATGGGVNGNIDSRVDATVDITQEGDILTLNPSFNNAKVRAVMIEALTKRGIKATDTGSGLALDTRSIPGFGAVQKMELTPAGLLVDAFPDTGMALK